MINKTHTLGYLIYWTVIFILSASMLLYGLGKPLQFSGQEISKPAGQLTGHQLMWLFYGHSKLYPIIIGAFEVIGGLSLLHTRTRMFGCLLLSSILLNIIIQDYVYEIVAFSTAIYYQLLVIVILIFDFDQLKKILTVLFSPGKPRIKTSVMMAALIIAVLLKLYETRLMNLL
ncbi:hypothetical protein [Chryseobacterium sp.]|uniref:hypothetical protein n=1 Tax=Chryseobacterium sp. TaxID=1871047 RepID=UPI0011C8EF34|nr:hypothetical protein [Chryseobacterium sp.]TXF77768.1 hypothetical protein FUA25_07550 [Chryseobacterium sp.]